MKEKVQFILLCVSILALSLACGSLGYKLGVKRDPGVVYLQDYNCSMKYTHAQEELEAFHCILHRIWIDNPSYVEDVLTECDEFCTLDSLTDFRDVFEFWSEQDSIDYHNSMEIQMIEADLYLKHYREPDNESANVETRTINNH